MWEIIKMWFYYTLKERDYIKQVINFEGYVICKTISEIVVLSDETKSEVLDYYGLQYNK